MPKSLLKVVVCSLLVASLLLLGGCESISYYSQVASGHWSVWWQRQPIDELVSGETLSPKLQQRLRSVLTIRDFASAELGLPDNGSYRHYSDIQRPYVVWNVFATQEFSVDPTQWCFPIAGCVSYRGYFAEQAALDYAQGLAEQGLDTYVGGVAAYSTLGWFDDPVLNTFIYRDEVRLAGLIFHELAHQQLYLPGDTTFNESFARAVEIAGIKRWLQAKQHPELIAAYLRRQRIHEDFIATMLDTRQQLAVLYQGDLPDEDKRQRKQQIISDVVQRQYLEFKARWGGYTGFDQWMGLDLDDSAGLGSHQPLNNAKLSTLASYHQWLPAMQVLLASCKDNLSCFYRRVSDLSKQDPEQRAQQLLELSGPS